MRKIGLLAVLLGMQAREERLPERDALLAATTRIRKRLARDRNKRLDVTRVLYMANLLHISRHDAPMFDDPIEATTYGPIVPRAMDELIYHPRRDEDAFHPASLSSVQRALIDEVCDHYFNTTSAQMVATVQANGGAWARRYQTGFATDRGPMIGLQDLRDEIASRLKTAAAEKELELEAA